MHIPSNSFTGIALQKGLSSNILNPPNVEQGRFSTYIGKPLRGILRYIYMVAIQILLSPLGWSMHFGAAIRHRVRSLFIKEPLWKSEVIKISNEHFKAAGRDFGAMTFLILGVIIPIVGNIAAFHYALNPQEATTRFYKKEDRALLHTAVNMRDNQAFQEYGVRSSRLPDIHSKQVEIYASEIDPNMRRKIDHRGVSSYFSFFLYTI